MSDWHLVASEEEVQADKPLVVSFEDKDVALFKIGDDFFAIDEHCPHQGAPFSTQGILNPEKKEVACSWHGWRFDLESGRSTNVPGFRTTVYEVQNEGGALSIRKKGGTSSAAKEATVETEQDKSLLQKVLNVVESDIRPAVQMDGGDIEIVGIAEGVVKVRLHGACVSCSSSAITLYQGVQNILSQKVEGVRGVEQVY